MSSNANNPVAEMGTTAERVWAVAKEEKKKFAFAYQCGLKDSEDKRHEFYGVERQFYVQGREAKEES